MGNMVVDRIQMGHVIPDEPTVCGRGLIQIPAPEMPLEQQIMEIYERLDDSHRKEFCEYLLSLLT